MFEAYNNLRMRAIDPHLKVRYRETGLLPPYGKRLRKLIVPIGIRMNDYYVAMRDGLVKTKPFVPHHDNH